MAAPEYVPEDPTDDPRLVWVSPPRRPASWMADRPGDFPREFQPRGARLGAPGPDQGYAYTLLRLFDDKVHLVDGERRDDADVGAVEVAMKRSSLFGRAPVVHDVTVAFTVWGFLDENAPAELVKLRRALFEGVSLDSSYGRRRTIADAVPEATLRQTHQAVAAAYASDWRSLLDVTAATSPGE